MDLLKWSSVQDAAGNFATRAGRLAAGILDAGPPSSLKNHADLAQQPETASAPATTRLSLLKERYKSSPSEGLSPHRQDITTVDETPVLSSLDESSEVTRLKDQLDRLKKEMLHQSMSFEETMKQQQFQWTEEGRQNEARHLKDIQSTREELGRQLEARKGSAQETREGDLEKVLELKRQEIQQLRSEMAEMKHKEFGPSSELLPPGDPTTESVYEQLQTDYEELMMKCNGLEELQSGMVPLTQLAERDSFWKAELKKLEQATPDKNASALQDAQHLQQLKEEFDALRNVHEQQRQEKESLQIQRQRLEEETAKLQLALEQRDGVWQQELISSQTEQQNLRKQLESIKRELSDERDKLTSLKLSSEEVESERKNEIELRHAAQSHVRSLQKSMMEIDATGASLKQQLTDAASEIETLKESHTKQSEIQKSVLTSQISSLTEQNTTLHGAVETLQKRFEEVDQQRRRAEDELQMMKFAKENNKDESADSAKLAYDLEAATENLKLAESRNSIQGHEIDSLTQELDQLKQRRSLEVDSSGAAVSETMGEDRVKKLEAERDSCKEQLQRLKQQLIQMQEDQEASLHWRIEAEVKLAVEDYKNRLETDGGVSKQLLFPALRQELEESLQSEKQLWQTQLEQKDSELQNLQIALGELTYHGEAADKLRRDLRSAQEQMQSVKDALFDAHAEVAEANSSRKAAEASADGAHHQLKAQEERMHQLESSLFATKRELIEAAQKLRRMGNDEASMVDRRVVVQYLVTFLENRREREALDVMAKMLGFTEEEKRRVATSAGGRGLFGGTLAFVKGGISVATLGLLDRGLNSETGSQFADQWVDFLTKDEAPLEADDPLGFLQESSTPPKQRPQTLNLDDRDSTRMASSEASTSTHTIPRYEDYLGEKRPQSTNDTIRFNPHTKPRSIPPPFEASQ